MIVWFDEIAADDGRRVGGKAANLGECRRAGLPVPPGFCVSTDAYREATEEIAELLAADAQRGDAASARERILALSLPDALLNSIAEAYEHLGDGPVAVRSSATAEDLANASFAGQQDTYLGVNGIDAVLDAVRRCWASLWTDRAVDYRRQQGILDDDLALAVVVQVMVPADTAGVLFTRNPVTGDDTSMLVSASYGLGESVVGALVTPDTFAVSRETAIVTSREIGTKETRIDATPGGGTVTSPVSPADRARASLTDEQLRRLVELGEQVERHYGTGQDIEWACVGDELYLLQARPITTSHKAVEGHAPVRNKLEHTLRDDIIEHFPAPFPLDLYAVHHVQGVVQDLMGTAGLRAAPVSSLVHGDDDGIVRIAVTRPRLTPAVITRLPALLRRGMRHDPTDWPIEEAAYRRQLDGLTAQASRCASANDEAVLALARDAVAQVATITTDRFIRYLAPMMINRDVASWLIALAGAKKHTTPEDLYAGVAYKTAEITTAINTLAATARDTHVATSIIDAPQGSVGTTLAATAEGRAFLSVIDEFLATHGARTARLYLPFSNRSWREDPEVFYALLAATLRGAPLEQAHGIDPAETIERRLPRFLQRRWRANTERLRALHIGREGTVYLIEEFFCLARVGVDELARRLVSRGQLGHPDDTRFLYFHEVEDAITDAQPRQSVVARRRRKRGTAEAIWWDRGQTTDDGHTLKGLPASAGRAAGTARVIRSPDEFHRLQPGDILVCPYTDPTWTPLFALAAGVVADSGGPLSHAAIVAREYGIPAVLGAGRATSLPDGARIVVDGSAGTIVLETETTDRHLSDQPAPAS
ncbi:PEP/pyruvate-binding domain-containing protein [Tessaracoccus caeni]|uniref:PEP/pyruvate-binding domain-containing protein n=1 Tax=Tessaracoccus caeni TaxID=3031239 RepID=UPI0023D9A086|nr:PEP/pyruvate-binding domain-containing protein [Tessaracoccus caeni]MDF1488434.1 PEP/pyruvate-binding domain-containing protein [Tessaracoccus caeni]